MPADNAYGEYIARQGFESADIFPFNIPIDLSDCSEPDDVVSRTVKTVEGDRLIFRGFYSHPWCHIRAQKAG
jgi:hypothetical protein